ncbi:MAG: LptF/LptG family permease [Thermonemataceae bacterium]
MIFNLSSFRAKNISDSSFTYHHYMKDVDELNFERDSFQRKQRTYLSTIPKEAAIYYIHFYKEVTDTALANKPLPKAPDSLVQAFHDLRFNKKDTKAILQRALGQSRSFKSFVGSKIQVLDNTEDQLNKISIAMVKKYTYACACFIMFLIGAPLGAIIKKGGLGVPTLVSVFFFIIYYVLSMTGEKWVKESILPLEIGMWAADAILFFVGLLFLYQARNDSRMFDKDAYVYLYKRLKQRFTKASTPQNHQDKQIKALNKG